MNEFFSIRIKRTIALFTAASILMIFSVTGFAITQKTKTADTTVGAKAAVVMDLKNGRVLFEQNMHDRLAMASTTKIMTALIALEQGDLETYFTVDPIGIRVEGSSMGLIEGDEVNLYSLAVGMLLPSGNDAANTTAIHIAGSIPEFTKLMNEKAKALGLENTSYVTPSGLDAENHYSSAYDLALLTHYAMQNDMFREIAGQSSMRVEFGRPPYKRWLKNHNKLLQMYKKCIGVKTGFTDAAKRCLVSAAKNEDDVELIVVTLNSPDDFSIHTNLSEKYFSLYENVDMSAIIPEIDIPVVNAKGQAVQVSLVDKPIAALTDGETAKLNVTINAPKFVYAPVKRGDYIGTLTVSIDNAPVFTTNLVADFNVSAEVTGEKIGILEKMFKK